MWYTNCITCRKFSQFEINRFIQHLVLSRLNLPTLEGTKEKVYEGVHTSYRKLEKTKPDALLLATGSEVSLAEKAQNVLAAEGIDVSGVYACIRWNDFFIYKIKHICI
ncbi:transketolase-like TK C-terminal-containing protein [Peribacillus sp. NPDC097895]|uniref:transketolase-like TK C-terminal-containing protein n=1 Tax=Peribacillus sp. NPDC097895 TaxID=3390619 RepID=UPI003D079BA0